MDVVLASCATLPEPDPDQAPIEAAIRAGGLSVETRAWDDPHQRWDDAGCVVVRATWNYPWMVERFERWLEHVESVSRVFNPMPIVRWNLHKRYLLDLEAAGIPTTPTEVVTAGTDTTLAAILERRGWDDVVVKPAVSAGSFRTVHIRTDEHAAGEEHLADLLEDRDVLVQPFLPSVEGHGERSLIWIDGEVTHAIRKNPRFQGEDENVSTTSMPISDAERALAHAAVAAVPFDLDLLYARCDMAPDAGGAPMMMELELIEPSLFFPQGPQGLARFVQALKARS